MEQTKVPVSRAVLVRMNLVAMILFSMAVLILAGGCTSVGRSNRSGYEFRDGDGRVRTVEDDRRSFERESAQEELGAASSEKSVAIRQVLKRAEKGLEGKSEREQYYKAKPYLSNDLERLQFLRLDSTASRDRFLNSKGMNGDQVTHPPAMQSLVEQNDIAAGMTRKAVKESWGPPDDVEVAGNPIYGNEKWRYSEQVTSSEGYMTEKRTVIFESGRVVGWETR
ncbi:hypothetical protein BH10BDE1_BH10BDE1_24840 [soil metagenome]